MQGCAQPRQGLPFDNPVQAKRSAGYENSKLNRMQYTISILSFAALQKLSCGAVIVPFLDGLLYFLQ
jgi:hypothetical protein